jgi:hypothetical protein
MMWNEWVLDLTFGTEPMPCFCPYERDTGAIVTGMNMLTDRCPGELVGVVHLDGQEAVEKWCADNPDWHERYAKKPDDAALNQ